MNQKGDKFVIDIDKDIKAKKFQFVIKDSWIYCCPL